MTHSSLNSMFQLVSVCCCYCLQLVGLMIRWHQYVTSWSRYKRALMKVSSSR